MRPMPGGKIPILIALAAGAAASLAGCRTVESREAVAAVAEWPDECAGVAGYAAFRSALEEVAAARDGRRLRALFHPGGSMRVNGIGGSAGGTFDWGFDRPQAASVWEELDEILRLGCARRGERLYLPAMAALVEDGSVSTDVDMSLTDAPAFESREDGAAVIGRIAKGETVETIAHDPAGWVRVLVDGREAYVRAADLRSPHSFVLVLSNEGGRWGIAEFASGV